MTLSRRNLLATTAAAATATAATTGTAQATPRGHGGRRLRTGFERLADDGYALLDGQKVGVVTNPTGITRDVRHIVDVMHADDRGPDRRLRSRARPGRAPRRRAAPRAATTTPRPGRRSTTRT